MYPHMNHESGETLLNIKTIRAARNAYIETGDIGQNVIFLFECENQLISILDFNFIRLVATPSYLCFTVISYS